MSTQNPPPGFHLSKKGRVVKDGHGGKRSGSGRRPRTSAGSVAPRTTSARTSAPRAAANLESTAGSTRQPPRAPRQPSTTTSAFFLPRETREPRPLGSQNLTSAMPNLQVNANPARREPEAAQSFFPSQNANSGSILRDTLSQLNANLAFVNDNDEHADIASGGAEIDDTLLDEILLEGDDLLPEEDSDPPPQSLIHQYLRSVKQRIVTEIEKHGQPSCYKDGDFYHRPRHPVFALQSSVTTEFTPDVLYERDVFVWLPHLLPGHPDTFKCECGMHLSKHGYNENPVARRVRRALELDYFLFTNRFWCDKDRTDSPGCGASYQGTHPFIIAQLPRFVQEAFPTFISTRGAVDKSVMSQMNSLIVKRVGPSPFSEMISELQHRHHARIELMYYAAALHYGLHGTKHIPQFSAFNDCTGFAGCPPTSPYLKAMFIDYIGAHRIYMDRAQATLPLDIAKADHTFDVLKYMGGLNGEKIWKAEYNLVNRFEEVRAECLTLTKLLSFVREMFEKVQESLKALGHPPTMILYTDSPQSEQGFHEAITKSLAENVRHISTWTDLSPLQRTPTTNVSFDFCSYSIVMDDLAAEILSEATATHAGSIYVLGFAIKYHLSPDGTPELDVIQLRTSNRVVVFQVSAFKSRSHFVPSLIAILSNSSIIKVGFEIRKTLSIVADALSLPDLRTNIRSSANPSFIDLGEYAKLAGVVDDPNASYHALVGTVLTRCYLPPSSDMSWSSELSNSAIDALYTETDSIWQLWIALSQREAVGLRLTPNQATLHGQLITLVQGCKPVLRGSIIGQHSGYLDAAMDVNGQTRRINITPSRSLIQITEVLVPGAIHTLHRQTVDWIFNHGAQAIVATSQLRSRSSQSPLPSSSFIFGFSHPAPPSTTLDDDHSDFTISYDDSAHSGEIHFDMWEPSDNDLFMEDGDSDSESDQESDWDLEDALEALEALEHAHSILREAVAGDEVATRVLDDVFHFMDRLLRLLSKKHSAFKAFCHDFSEAIFIRDRDDERAVRTVLESRGVNWEFARRAKAAGLNRRIRRYIPDRHTLGKRLHLLFTGYQDIVCSTKTATSSRRTPDRFFSNDARDMAARLLETVRLGFLSDPQGISLYYVMGKDRDGLTLYRTVRGTNSVEGGVHMAVRRVFGSLKASPELAEKILIYWIFRRNQSVGYRNRTGRKFCGHFDLWVSDEIVEITALLDVMPSFRLPHLLATRIATVETFGIVPMDTTLATELGITTLPPRKLEGIPHHNDLPVHTLSRLSTHPMSQYRYLQLRQRTLHPVLPVSTHAEYRKFKELINDPIFQRGHANHPPHEAYKNIDFKLLAQSWNDKVNNQDRTIAETSRRLYYKLPAQLELHHKKTILWKSEWSTLFMGENAIALKAFTDLIASDDNSTSTLPAMTLPGNETDDAFRTLQDIREQLDLDSFDEMGHHPTAHLDADDEQTDDIPMAEGGDVGPSREDSGNQSDDVETRHQGGGDDMEVDSSGTQAVIPLASTSREHIFQQQMLQNDGTLGPRRERPLRPQARRKAAAPFAQRLCVVAVQTVQGKVAVSFVDVVIPRSRKAKEFG
ncbi:hypothetical protein BDZ89DRAFT_1011046 [Hymenopellis radicata]|nr:hypothetical protein BDZ89DRAFT_1011046 [Hymenopellis radicata]